MSTAIFEVGVLVDTGLQALVAVVERTRAAVVRICARVNASHTCAQTSNDHPGGSLSVSPNTSVPVAMARAVRTHCCILESGQFGVMSSEHTTAVQELPGCTFTGRLNPGTALMSQSATRQSQHETEGCTTISLTIEPAAVGVQVELSNLKI